MSGFYLLGVVALWMLLTWVLWSALRHLQYAPSERKRLPIIIILIAALLWLGATFWYAGGRKIYYDWQVDRRCAVDGGAKVYETVVLSSDKFNRWGQPNFYRPNQKERALGEEYVFKRLDRYYRNGAVKVMRHHYKVIRKLDDTLLGETVSYGRGGGDLPGPWHPSSYTCPDIKISGPNALIASVFIQAKED